MVQGLPRAPQRSQALTRMDLRLRCTPEHLRWVVGLIVLGAVQALAMAWPFAGEWQGQACGGLQFISMAGFALVLLRFGPAGGSPALG